eukprot:3081715-Pyramimonas_sp.AAC.1
MLCDALHPLLCPAMPCTPCTPLRCPAPPAMPCDALHLLPCDARRRCLEGQPEHSALCLRTPY